MAAPRVTLDSRSEEHTSELQSLANLVCRLLLEKKKQDLHIARPPLHDRARLAALVYSLLAPCDGLYGSDVAIEPPRADSGPAPDAPLRICPVPVVAPLSRCTESLGPGHDGHGEIIPTLVPHAPRVADGAKAGSSPLLACQSMAERKHLAPGFFFSNPAVPELPPFPPRDAVEI